MNIWKKGLSAGLSLVLCAGMVVPGFAASFAELQGAINGVGDTAENQFTAEDGTTRYGYGAKNGETGKYEIEAWDGQRQVLDSEGNETGETADTRHVQLNGEVKRQDGEINGWNRGTTITIADGADVTLDLNGNNVDANQSNNSVITITTGGQLTLTDSAASTYIDEEGNEQYQSGTVTGGGGRNNLDGFGADITGGGGVYNNGGTLIMDGGVITGNTAYHGGGVFNYNGGTLIMDGGIITGNTANNSGGGVFNYNGGTFTMNGGKISDNTTVDGHGGGVYNRATFTMTGGEISGNTAGGGEGGGVDSNGTFTMNGGKISGNMTNFGGGVSNTGTFTMNGGKVTGNTANNSGGGVKNDGGGAKFTMTGGEISGNTAGGEGGGVFDSWYGTFIMNDGKISGNMADWGGGVYVSSSSGGKFAGTFTMNGGEISGNTAKFAGDEITSTSKHTLTLPEDSLWESDGVAQRGGSSPAQVYSGAEVNDAVASDRIDLKHHEHSFTEEKTTQPTCTEAGEKMSSGCTCGQTLTEEIDPLGHDMPDEWYPTKAAQPGVPGEERRDCQREGCDHFETRPIAALPTNNNNNNNNNNSNNNNNGNDNNNQNNQNNQTDPTVEVEEPDVPLGELPEGGGDPVEIDEPETPLGELPETEGGSGGTVEIDGPDVPLDGVPQTGEASAAVWLAVLLACGLGLVYVNTGKRRENA